jgi:hypothetical protein
MADTHLVLRVLVGTGLEQHSRTLGVTAGGGADQRRPSDLRAFANHATG